jgi:hypothetical protein
MSTEQITEVAQGFVVNVRCRYRDGDVLSH